MHTAPEEAFIDESDAQSDLFPVTSNHIELKTFPTGFRAMVPSTETKFYGKYWSNTKMLEHTLLGYQYIT